MQPLLTALLLILSLLPHAQANPPIERLLSDPSASSFVPVQFGQHPILYGLIKVTQAQAPLLVVIEGDGRAWLSMNQVSPNPTPRDATGWRLAAQASCANVLYLSRPCQFLETAAREAACTTSDWTHARFASRWVERIGRAIDDTLNQHPFSGIHLAGYSGGGVIAALLAAQRPDVLSLVTVASPLDHAAWTQYHQISPLSESLNAADVRAQLATLPQVHLVGADDQTVPAYLLHQFVAAYPKTTPARVETLAGVNHKFKQTPDLGAVKIPTSPLVTIGATRICP